VNPVDPVERSSPLARLDTTAQGVGVRHPLFALVLLTATIVGCGDGGADAPPLVPSFTYDYRLDTTGRTVCTVEEITFTDTSTGGPTSWRWDFGDGQTSTERNPVVTPRSGTPGTLKVTLVVGRDGDTADHVQEIVFPLC
jgi:PKD repeat protein